MDTTRTHSYVLTASQRAVLWFVLVPIVLGLLSGGFVSGTRVGLHTVILGVYFYAAMLWGISAMSLAGSFSVRMSIKIRKAAYVCSFIFLHWVSYFWAALGCGGMLEIYEPRFEILLRIVTFPVCKFRLDDQHDPADTATLINFLCLPTSLVLLFCLSCFWAWLTWRLIDKFLLQKLHFSNRDSCDEDANVYSTPISPFIANLLIVLLLLLVPLVVGFLSGGVVASTQVGLHTWSLGILFYAALLWGIGAVSLIFSVNWKSCFGIDTARFFGGRYRANFSYTIKVFSPIFGVLALLFRRRSKPKSLHSLYGKRNSQVNKSVYFCCFLFFHLGALWSIAMMNVSFFGDPINPRIVTLTHIAAFPVIQVVESTDVFLMAQIQQIDNELLKDVVKLIVTLNMLASILCLSYFWAWFTWRLTNKVVVKKFILSSSHRNLKVTDAVF